MGYAQLTLKSDQEPAILALTNAVKNTLSAKGVTCRLENSPKGDAHGMSNGESESSVANAQGLARTLKDHVEFKIEKMINCKSPLLPWLVEYVGTLYTLFSFDEKSKDGMTPFRKLKGRDWVISLPSFGECVDYRVRTQHKLEARLDIGIYLGIRLHTTEKNHWNPTRSRCCTVYQTQASTSTVECQFDRKARGYSMGAKSWNAEEQSGSFRAT